MLTSNLLEKLGLVNGNCYGNGTASLVLPIAVTVKLDSYSGPTLSVNSDYYSLYVLFNMFPIRMCHFAIT